MRGRQNFCLRPQFYCNEKQALFRADVSGLSGGGDYRTVVQPHFHAVEYFTWPGMGISLVVFVLVHADYFGHPRLITCLDILFNALLWAAIISLIRALLRATIWHPRRSG